MDGVVTILLQPYNQTVRDLWARIHALCRTSPVAPQFLNDADLPHFSWHVAESYDQNKLCVLLEAICQDTAPFIVRTSGLGVFTAPKPVVYIAIVKDRALLSLHERLWQQLDGVGQGVSPYYAPDLWAPHITLAHENIDPSSMACIVQELALYPFDWEMQVSSLAVASKASSGEMQACFQYQFMKG